MNKQPNVILVVTDQQRWDSLGAYGNPFIRTPNLDRLAAGGILCDRSYTNNPVCTPSRCSILTGRYPHAHGVTCTGIPLPDDEQTLAHTFGRAGYHTAAIGKLHITPTEATASDRYVEAKKMDDAGKAFFRQWTGPYFGFDWVQMSVGHTTDANRGHYGLWLEDNYPEVLCHFEQPHAHAIEPPTDAKFGSLKWGLPVEAHGTTWIADTACQYLDAHAARGADQPFFLWVGVQDPHPPLACPAPYCDLYAPADMPTPIPPPERWDDYPPHLEAIHRGPNGGATAASTTPNQKGQIWSKDFAGITEAQAREMAAHYYGMVTLIDHQVGRVLEKLTELGIENDTIVVFTTDHGECLGDHGLWLKGAYHYDSVIRTPMIWSWPGRIAAGRTASLFGHVDIAPTLLALAGVASHDGVQGVSQTDVLTGRTQRARGRMLCEYRVPDGPGIHINMKTLLTDRYKLTYYGTSAYGELFDLKADPQERTNLWHERTMQGTKQNLLHELWAELMATEDPLPRRICRY